jgi:anti-sigma factor RsiW
MSCERYGEKLSAYLDGELEYETRAELEKHLLECAACARQLEEMRRIESFKPLLEPPEVPQEKWRECWDDIRKQTTSSLTVAQVEAGLVRRRKRFWLRRALAGAGAAAVAAVIVAAVLLLPAEVPEEMGLPAPQATIPSSVCVHDWDDSKYNLYIIDKPNYTIVKLMPIKDHEGG